MKNLFHSLHTRVAYCICALVFASLLSFAAGAHIARASDVTFELYPTVGSVDTGAFISMGLFLTSSATAINAASAVLSYPSDLLEVVSLDTTNSIFNLWVDPPSYSNETGTVKLGGVAFNPGFKGKSGRVLTVRFKVKAPGKAIVRFVSDMVLANDGKGTELHADMNATAAFTINVAGAATPTTDDEASANLNTNGSQSGSSFPVLPIVLVVLLAMAGVIAAFYNSYHLKRIEERMNGPKLSGHDAEIIKKLKKDLDMAEEMIEKSAEKDKQ